MGSLLPVIIVVLVLVVVAGYFRVRQQKQDLERIIRMGKTTTPEEAIADILDAKRGSTGGEKGPGRGAALGALIDQMRVMNQAMGKGGTTPTFGEADLAQVKSAFARFRTEPGEASAQACFQVMRRHYVLDTEMARQESYFLQYAGEVLRQVREHPAVLDAPMSMYITYLAVDLGDSGSAPLGKLGQELTAAIKATGHSL